LDENVLDSLRSIANDTDICNFSFNDPFLDENGLFVFEGEDQVNKYNFDDLFVEDGFKNQSPLVVEVKDSIEDDSSCRNPPEVEVKDLTLSGQSEGSDMYFVEDISCRVEVYKNLDLLTNHNEEDYNLQRNVIDWRDSIDLLTGAVPYFITQQGVDDMRDYLYTFPHKVLRKKSKVKGFGEYMLYEGRKYDKRVLIEQLIRVYIFRNVFRDEIVIDTFGDDFNLDSHLMGKVVSYLKQPLVFLEIEKDIILNKDMWIRRHFLDPGDMDLSQDFKEILSRYEVCYQLLLLEELRAVSLSKKDMTLIKETLLYVLSLCSNRSSIIERDLNRIVDKDKLYFVILRRLDYLQLLELYRKDGIGTSFFDYILIFLEIELCLRIKNSCIDYLIGIGTLDTIF